MSPENSSGQNEPFKKSEDLSDILTYGKSGDTAHRPYDGKFISNSELKDIEAHADQIREGVVELEEHKANMSLMQIEIEARRASESNDSRTVQQMRDLYEHNLMDIATDPNNAAENLTQEQFDEKMALFDKSVNIENTPTKSSSEGANNTDKAADTQEQGTGVSNTSEKRVHSRIEEIENSNMSDEAKKAIIDILKDTEEYESEQQAELDKAHELGIEINNAITELETIQGERDSLKELRDGDKDAIASARELAERLGEDDLSRFDSMSASLESLQADYEQLDAEEAAVMARLAELGYKLPEIEGGEGLPKGLFAKMKNGLNKMYLKAASIVVPAISYFEPSKLMVPKRLENESDQEYEKREKKRRILVYIGATAGAAVGIYAISRGISSSMGGGSAHEASTHVASNPSILDNANLGSTHGIENIDTSSIPDSNGLDTLPVVGGEHADAISQFSQEARTVTSGEGWYNTFSQMKISPSEHHALLDKIGPQLQDQGWAYFDDGWKISHTGQLPEDVLEFINKSR